MVHKTRIGLYLALIAVVYTRKFLSSSGGKKGRIRVKNGSIWSGLSWNVGEDLLSCMCRSQLQLGKEVFVV